MNLSYLYNIQRRNNILLFQKGAGSGVLTLPDFENNFFLKVTGCAGGAGGAAGSYYGGDPTLTSGGLGGASGCALRDFIFEVEPGVSINWSVGAGGAGATYSGNETSPVVGAAGGDTYLENYVTMPGARRSVASSYFFFLVDFTWSAFALADVSDNLNTFSNDVYRFVNKQPESLYMEQAISGQGTEGNFDLTAKNGTYFTDGGQPGAGDGTFYGGGGGSAGPFGNGGDGGNSSNNNGQDATGYGSGGGGGYCDYNGGSHILGDGGNGSDGFLLVEYILEDNFRMKHMYHQKI